jgi:hypothetical protein
VTATLEPIGMLLVVDHLIFDAQPLLAADLGDPILHAVVAARFDLPFPLKLEAGVLFI